MQKWEYCAIVLGGSGWSVAMLSTRAPGYTEIRIQPDKSKGDSNKIQALYRTIAELGLDGWEMVGEFADTKIVEGDLIFFKRPML